MSHEILSYPWFVLDYRFDPVDWYCRIVIISIIYKFTTYSKYNLSSHQFLHLRKHNLFAVLNVASTPSSLLYPCMFIIGLVNSFGTLSNYWSCYQCILRTLIERDLGFSKHLAPSLVIRCHLFRFDCVPLLGNYSHNIIHWLWIHSTMENWKCLACKKENQSEAITCD